MRIDGQENPVQEILAYEHRTKGGDNRAALVTASDTAFEAQKRTEDPRKEDFSINRPDTIDISEKAREFERISRGETPDKDNSNPDKGKNPFRNN